MKKSCDFFISRTTTHWLSKSLKCQVLTMFCCLIPPPIMRGRLFLKTTVFKVFNNFHKLAHSGTETTVKMMQTRVIWPGMRKQISSWSKSCIECQKGKVWKHNWAPMQKFDLPLQRFQNVCIDLVGKLPMSEGYQ